MSKMIADDSTVFGLSDLELKVANHLNVSPNPTDADFHRWAEGQGIEVDEAESAAYKLATFAVQFLYGGRANEKGLSEDKVDSLELKNGTQIEFEHTPNKQMAMRIALDHLAETGGVRYYACLKVMEKLIERHRDTSNEKFDEILQDIGEM